MDPQNQQPVPQQPTPLAPMPAEHKKIGPIIAILIIVLILVIGALYLFASRINQQQAPVNTSVANTSAQTSASTQSVQPVTNTSDDVNALQADLNVSTAGLDNQNF